MTERFKPPKMHDVRIGLTLIKSCDDCMYSDLDGLDAVCRISNAKHGGEYISKECPLPQWNTDFDTLMTLMWSTNLTWGAVCNIIQEAINNASIDCLDCKNLIRSYDDYGEIADIECQKNGKLIQNGMCGCCKHYEEVQKE